MAKNYLKVKIKKKLSYKCDNCQKYHSSHYLFLRRHGVKIFISSVCSNCNYEKIYGEVKKYEKKFGHADNLYAHAFNRL